MSPGLPSDFRAKAIEIVQMIVDQSRSQPSTAQLAHLISAVARDLEDLANKAVVDQGRLANGVAGP
jgi:hypothetical protein